MPSPLSPCSFFFCPSSCTQQEQVSCYSLLQPSLAFCTTGQQPTKRCCWEITSQTGKSLTDNGSENGRFFCSVLYHSREGASAAKPFWLWSPRGKGRYQLGVAPKLIKHLSSSYLPAAGADGTVQGLWAGKMDWPLETEMTTWKCGFKSRLSYGWSMWCWSNYLLLSVSVPRWNRGSRSLCKSP